MLPEKSGKCDQIVLNLLDSWVNATRNNLLIFFLFFSNEYMSFGGDYRVKVIYTLIK